MRRIGRAFYRAEDTLSSVLAKSRMWERIRRQPVNERQRLVLNRLLDGFKGPLTTAKYATLAKCSSDTALRDIQALIERGLFVQMPGGGRSTSYRLATLAELTDEAASASASAPCPVFSPNEGHGVE